MAGDTVTVQLSDPVPVAVSVAPTVVQVQLLDPVPVQPGTPGTTVAVQLQAPYPVEVVAAPVTVTVELVDPLPITLGATTTGGGTAVDLDLINAGFPSTTFIYNSTGPQAGTRFNVWADLMTALNRTEYGGPRNILIERNETIPAGTYDLTDVTLLGNGFGTLNGGLRLTFADGCSLTNDILRIGGGLSVLWAGTGYLMDGVDVNGATKSIQLLDRAAIFAVGGGAVIGLGGDDGNTVVNGEAQLVAAQGETCIFAGDGAFPGVNGHLVAFRCAAGGARSLVYVDNGWGTITTPYTCRCDGPNNPGASLYLNSPTIDTVFSTLPTYLTMAGGAGPATITVQRLLYASSAARVAYTPAVTGNWTGADPALVSQALDRLAQALVDNGFLPP